MVLVTGCTISVALLHHTVRYSARLSEHVYGYIAVARDIHPVAVQHWVGDIRCSAWKGLLRARLDSAYHSDVAFKFLHRVLPTPHRLPSVPRPRLSLILVDTVVLRLTTFLAVVLRQVSSDFLFVTFCLYFFPLFRPT